MFDASAPPSVNKWNYLLEQLREFSTQVGEADSGYSDCSGADNQFWRLERECGRFALLSYGMIGFAALKASLTAARKMRKEIV